MDHLLNTAGNTDVRIVGVQLVTTKTWVSHTNILNHTKIIVAVADRLWIGGDGMKPIYIPKGKAKEYGDYAINIYTGCPHRCYYCFAPNVLHRDRELFHSNITPRENIVEETEKQIARENITGKLIHLCFT